MDHDADSDSEWVMIDESDGQLNVRRSSRDSFSRLSDHSSHNSVNHSIHGSDSRLTRKRSKVNVGSISIGTLSTYSGHSSSYGSNYSLINQINGSYKSVDIDNDYSAKDSDLIVFDRNIHVDVSMGDTLSRVWVVFENQRWYYGVGWSSTLATDRCNYSNHSGSVGVKDRPSFMGKACDTDTISYSKYETCKVDKHKRHRERHSTPKVQDPREIDLASNLQEQKRIQETQITNVIPRTVTHKLKWWVDLSTREEGLCDGSGWTYAFNFSDLRKVETMGSSDPEGCLVRRRRWLCVVPPNTTSVPHPVVSVISVSVPPENFVPADPGTPQTKRTQPLAIPCKPRDMIVEYKVLVDLNMVYSKVEHMKADGYCGMAQTLDNAKLIAAKYMSRCRNLPTDHLYSSKESLPVDHVFSNKEADTDSESCLSMGADTYYVTWHRPKLGGCWAGRVYAWPISRVREAGREDPLSWIPEKHVTSMIVFNAQREYDAQLGLDITLGRLSYDMEMDILSPIDYTSRTKES